MKLQGFTLSIPEGREVHDGYVELPHKTQYSLNLANDSGVRCDVEIFIEGGRVGVWRIASHAAVRIERPVHDTGRFTFYRAGTPEARKANITISDKTGLLRAIFKPERDEPILFASRASSGAGGTGLSSRSEQKFTTVAPLDYDEAAFVTINLRLVCLNT